MIFRPFQFTIRTPRSGGGDSMPAAAAPQRPIRNVIFPIAVTLDLLTIPVAGTRDFFLWMPYQGTIQDIYLGADENDVTTPEPVKVQLIQANGNVETELTAPEEYSTFGIEPVTLNQSGQVLDGPVFLRVTTQPTDRLLFATVHVMTPEIP